MALAPVLLLQRQLDTTLQLFILFSPAMTTDQLMTVRIHLTEASVVLGHVMAERGRDSSEMNGAFH